MFEDPTQATRGEPSLGSAANAQHCMLVGLGQLAEAPTQRRCKALRDLRGVNMIMSALQRRGC